MNLLQDLLGLFKRNKFVSAPKLNDFIPIGVDKGKAPGVDSAEKPELRIVRLSKLKALLGGSSATDDLRKKTVVITPEQVLTLNNGGTIEVLPAPGADKVYAIMNVVYKIDFNSVAYNFAGDFMSGQKVHFKLGNTDLNSNQFFAYGTLNSTNDYFNIADPLTGGNAIAPNSPLNIVSTSGTTVSQGDSPLKFSILYRELSI